MDITIDFPGDMRVDAHIGERTIATDQVPPHEDIGGGPPPFTLFLAALGTCAGVYVLQFCRQRGLPTENIRIIERTHSNPQTRRIETIDLEIQVPPDFPEKYYDALVRSANQCAVKQYLENPPAINSYTKATE